MPNSATKIACGVQYLGTEYCGWQSQKEQVTIQDNIERAIGVVANQNIRIYGAGRTDSGVHAKGQVFHFITSSKRDPEQWMDGINSNLSEDILIQWVKEVPMDFDARMSAIDRRYDYCIQNIKQNIFFNKRALFIRQELNIDSMKNASRYLIGKHDFSSFRASSCQSRNPIREMKLIEIEGKYQLRFTFIANAYLHHMIRNIMGTLIDIGLGKIEPIQMKLILDSKDRSNASKKVSADGLYLIDISYPDKYLLPRTTIEIV